MDDDGLIVADDRTFGLYGFRHGHSYVHVRGFPSMDADDERYSRHQTTLDLVFWHAHRVSCDLHFSPLALRQATPDERAVVDRRVGPLPRLKRVFLLAPDSIDSYVVASSLVVAEFAIGGGAVSPLLSASDPEYVARHPPVQPMASY